MGNVAGKHICGPDFATRAIRQAFLDRCRIRNQSYRAVVDRVASPAHDIQDVVGPVHLAVDAVQDGVVCMGHITGIEQTYKLEVKDFYSLTIQNDLKTLE